MGCDLVHVAMPKNAAARAKWPSELIPEQIDDEDIISNVDKIMRDAQQAGGYKLS